MTAASLSSRSEHGVFRPIVVLSLVLAGVFSFSAYAVLSAYAPDLKGGEEGGANALSRSAVGYAGMVRLLRAQDIPVLISREPAAKRDPRWGLLVLTPPASAKASDIVEFTEAGPTLVVLPKWQVLPDPLHSGWVLALGGIDPGALKSLLAGRVMATVTARADRGPARLTIADDATGGPLATGPIEHLQTLAAPGMVTLVSDASGAPVLVRSADSRLYILADPDLLDTQGLRDAKTARVGAELLLGLRNGSGPIVFDVSLDGYRHSPGLLKLAFEPPFLGATLCLLGAALLMALQAASRFGAPARAGRALALGKSALADTSAGLIRMAKREPRMAGRYLDLSRAAVARGLGATRLSGPELDAYIDRLGERAGAGRLSGLAAQVTAVRDRDGLVRFAQRLYQWRLEMTRERR
jgi:uncharacterized protein DUF4350